jgi:hypothetical protein
MAAAFAFMILAAAAGSAVAQESQTVGPEQLKDFQLPGTRTTPPAQTTPPPQNQPTTQPTAPPAVERPAAPAPERRPAPTTTAPAETPAATAAPEPDPLLLPEAGSELPADANQSAPAEPPIVLPSAPSNPDLDSLPPPIVADEEAEPAATSWLPWLAVPAGLALLAWAALAWRRRRAEAEAEAVRRAAREDLGGVLFSGAANKPAPAPEPAPVASPALAPAAAPMAAAEGPRPWLEVEVKPERAAATATQAVVDYALSIVNSGDAPAGNIRIDARLFNASAEDEVAAFIAGPIHEKSGSPQVVLAPGESLDLVGQAAMPKGAVREVVIEGRRLLIPMIAINVAYDWGEAGAGRTSRSWVVGREPQTPAAKMGAFRLDLGPRIYRSVAGREARLVKV